MEEEKTMRETDSSSKNCINRNIKVNTIKRHDIMMNRIQKNFISNIFTSNENSPTKINTGEDPLLQKV